MDFLNKPYRRRQSAPDSDIFTPISVENGWVLFANDAKCKEETFQTDFVAADQINESIVPVVDIINSETIDPEAFFMGSQQATKKLIMSQVDNPNQSKPRINNQQGGVVSIDGNITNANISMYDNPYEQTVENSTNQVNTIQIPLTPVENRLPEYDVFDRVKKSETIDINITFKLSLPRPEKLDAMNDLFETSFTAYLAKQYIKENIVKNPITIQIAIKDAIEHWMNEQLYGKLKSRAKTAKKTTIKTRRKPVVKKIITKESQQEQVSDILSTLNQGAIVYTIADDTELEKMRAKLLNLYEDNPQSYDIVIIEDVINEYISK